MVSYPFGQVAQEEVNLEEQGFEVRLKTEDEKIDDYYKMLKFEETQLDNTLTLDQ